MVHKYLLFQVLDGDEFDLEMKDESLLSLKIKKFSQANEVPEQNSKAKNDEKQKDVKNDSKNDDKQKDTKNQKPKDAEAKKSEPEVKKTPEMSPVTTTNDRIGN